MSSTRLLDTSIEDLQPTAKKMKVESILRFAKLTDKAFAPVRASPMAAGLDLQSAYDIIVPARGKAVVKTDLQIEVPEGTYGRVAPRSGLAVKNFIDVGAGVIDADYRGNVGVVLFNHSDIEFKVNRGDRIAQLICTSIVYPTPTECKQLDDTERGAGGFGSTGVKALTTDSKENENEQGNGKEKEDTNGKEKMDVDGKNKQEEEEDTKKKNKEDTNGEDKKEHVNGK